MPHRRIEVLLPGFIWNVRVKMPDTPSGTLNLRVLGFCKFNIRRKSPVFKHISDCFHRVRPWNHLRIRHKPRFRPAVNLNFLIVKPYRSLSEIRIESPPTAINLTHCPGNLILWLALLELRDDLHSLIRGDWITQNHLKNHPCKRKSGNRHSFRSLDWFNLFVLWWE